MSEALRDGGCGLPPCLRCDELRALIFVYFFMTGGLVADTLAWAASLASRADAFASADAFALAAASTFAFDDAISALDSAPAAPGIFACSSICFTFTGSVALAGIVAAASSVTAVMAKTIFFMDWVYLIRVERSYLRTRNSSLYRIFSCRNTQSCIATPV